MKVPKYLEWEYCSRYLRVIEVIAVVLAASLIIQIPEQLNEWRNAQESRSIDLLLRLEQPLKTSTNDAIYERIENNQTIFKKNKGPYTDNQVDTYLNDLTSVCDAYQRNLISLQSVYEWYGDYIIKTYNNKEIQQYIQKVRLENPEYFSGLDIMVNDLNNYK